MSRVLLSDCNLNSDCADGSEVCKADLDGQPFFFALFILLRFETGVQSVFVLMTVQFF